MKNLIVWLNSIINKHKALKRWRWVVTVLAAIMTFVTTYALILPAITVEREHTDKVAGMFLEQEEAQDDLLEENALEFTSVSIAADQENAVTYEYADDDMKAVAVFSTEEEIPEGTELVVNPVDTESEKYAELSNRAALLLDREFIYDVTTCSFYDFALICDGVDVTPKTGLVDVQISFLNNTVEHVEDVVFAGRFGRFIDKSNGFATMSADNMDEVGATAEAVDTHDADNDLAGSGNQEDINDELISTNPDESPVIELTDSIITTLSLKGNDLSQADRVVGILAGHVDEEAKAAAAETDAEVPSVDDIQEETSAPEVKTLKAVGKDYTVTLTYDETSEIPEGASLVVSEIAQDTKEYKTYLEKTKKAMGLSEEENLSRFAARFFDIKIMVGDNEFKPESGVSVEITYAEPLAENQETEVSAVHFADKKAKAEVIEANTSEVQDDGAATVEFTAESFSVYGVIYTVDFYWNVDGRTEKWNLAGGSAIGLKELVRVLRIVERDAANEADAPAEGIEDDLADAMENFPLEETEDDLGDAMETSVVDDEAYMEKIDLFMQNVAQVTFSDESLVKVAQVTADTTLGNLKEDLALAPQYSAELTEETVASMDEMLFTAPDWALISLKPFSTEEALIVTMKDDEVFVIRVTDNMANDPLGVNNESFVITNRTERTETYWEWGQQKTRVVIEYPRSVKAQIDNNNGHPDSLQAQNPPSGDANNIWKFEYDEYANDGHGGYYIVCEINGTQNYINATDGALSLTQTKLPPEEGEEQTDVKTATPFVISYDTDTMRYRISASSTGTGAYLTYVNDGGNGRFALTDTATDDNLLALRDTEHPVSTPGFVGTWDIQRDDIVLKLFDYDGKTTNNSSIDSQWAPNDLNTLRNGTGINNGRSLLFSGSGISAGNEDFNKFTGSKGDNDKFYSGYARQNIVMHNLDGEGFPVLTDNNRTGWRDKNKGGDNQDGHTDGSLGYLFDDNSITGGNAKTAYVGEIGDDGKAKGLKGLLRKDDEGYYYYDSEQNFAILNDDKDELLLYSDTYRKNKGTTDVKTEKIGLFPFDTYDASKGEEKTPSGGKYHHQFGMSIGTDFVYPKNGIVPETNKPMTFEFSGDDDVWVFVDGVLVLDLGGVHQPISGKIDFSTGKVTITEFGSDGYEYISDKSTTIDAMFKAASQEKYHNDTSISFNYDDFSTHHLDFFYLERGGCDSNCKIKFNLLLMTTLTMGKQVNGLTPAEREKYLNDPFNLELGLKHNDNGLNMNENHDAYWANTTWRNGFAPYNTEKTTTDAGENFTIHTDKNGNDTVGVPVVNGQVTLRDGESMTVTHLPKSDILYVMEQNSDVMQQFETPHAERNYQINGEDVQREEEVVLHSNTSIVNNSLYGWETRAYKAGETNKVVYTNTLREKNLTVRKVWKDSKKTEDHPAVQFKLLATVEGSPYSGETAGYNSINAQWTETNGQGVTTTRTEDVYLNTQAGKKFTLSKDNNWEIDFEHLPAMTNSPTGTGKEIMYSVEEIVPDEYSVTYGELEDTNEMYLDLYKLWPDGNAMHDGTTDKKKAEDIYTYVKRNDGMYLKGALDDNGEYVYAGVTDNVEEATQFKLTTKNRLSNLKTSDQMEMLDYAVRINSVPKTDGAEEDPVAYTYSIDQQTDEDPLTTGLVMFTRPKMKTEITNTKGQVKIEKTWLDEEGNSLGEEDRPDGITYSVYRLRHDHEWAVYDKATSTWDYNRKADGEGWYVVREAYMNDDGEWVDGLEKRVCRFNSCGHYSEERTVVPEPCETHLWGDWEVTTPATCTENGEQTRTCVRCKQTETQTIEAPGHDNEVMTVPAQCGVPGSETYTCKRCGASYSIELPALEHIWGDWETDPNDSNWQICYCRRDHSHFQRRSAGQTYPGTGGNGLQPPLHLIDKNSVWPTWEQYGSDDSWRNDTQQVKKSGVFKENGKYYVIYNDGAPNNYQWQWSTEQINGQNRDKIEGYVIQLDGQPARKMSDVYGGYTWKDVGLHKGAVLLDDTTGKYYVYVKDDNWSGPPSEHPECWYEIAALEAGASNGTNAAAGGRNGRKVLATQRTAKGTDDEEPPKVPGGPSRGQPINKNLTLADLLAALNLSGLGVKNPDTGDTLTLYKPGELETKSNSETLVDGEDNLWRTVEDVPLTDEHGTEYRYYVVEDAPAVGGDYEIIYEGQSDGLTDGDTVTITNKVKPKKGALELTKVVTVNDEADTTALTDGTYTFTVEGVEDTETAEESHTVDITFKNGKAESYKIDDGELQSVTGIDNSWSVVVPELTPGDYTVTETSSGKLELVSITGGKSEEPAEASNSIVATVTADDTDPNSPEAKVTFTNNISLANIKVVKVVADVKTPLSGAGFTLTKVDDTGKEITEEGEAYTSGELMVDDNGELTFEGILSGRYLLEETTTPKGFVKIEGPYYIKVDRHGISSLDMNETVAHELITPDEENDNTYIVENVPGAKLPYTGGPGTVLFYLIGTILAAGAAGILMKRKLV